MGELPEAEWNPGVWPVEKYKAEKEIRSAGDRNLKMWWSGKVPLRNDISAKI